MRIKLKRNWNYNDHRDAALRLSDSDGAIECDASGDSPTQLSASDMSRYAPQSLKINSVVRVLRFIDEKENTEDESESPNPAEKKEKKSVEGTEEKTM